MSVLCHCQRMNSKNIYVSLLATLFLAACERAPMLENRGADEPAQNRADNALVDPVARPPRTNASANAAVSNEADSAPPILTPQAERSIKGARNVLLSFARAIEQQQYAQAWALLGPGDQQKWSREEFAANFAGLSNISVAIPTGTTDGAAGSIYYTAPVTITATDKDGRPIRFEGEAVLRRVNDVDGATPAQLRWHFGTLTLDWTH